MDKYDEGTLVVRPQLYLGEHWGLALEGSYQERRYGVIDPVTGSQLDASEWRGGIIPYFSPSGRGSYKRPQLRAIYAITDRNQGRASSIRPTTSSRSGRSSTSSASGPSGGSTRARTPERYAAVPAPRRARRA